MKSPHPLSRTTGGFTLAEVAIAMGIAAGVLAILTMVMGALTRDVRRLKPYEAWKRPAFVSKPQSSSNSGSSTDTNTSNNTSPPVITPTNTLPDENLDPNTRPDETAVPPDPDDPEAKDPNQPAAPTSDGSATPP